MNYLKLKSLLCVLAGLSLFLTNVSPSAAQPKQVSSKASVFGKYYNLERKLHVPQDKETFTDFCDWGFDHPFDSYQGHPNVPAGYWVYLYPDWYIWRDLDISRDNSIQKATLDGKYSQFLKKMRVGTDLKQYGLFRELGYVSLTNYSTYNNLPAGYWVYDFPYWYIFGKMNPLSKNPPPVSPHEPRPPFSFFPSHTPTSYVVKIKTGKVPGAGTDAPVFLTVNGTHGRIGETRIDQSIYENWFEPGKQDTVVLNHFKNIGAIKSVTIRLDNSQRISPWNLHSIQITGGGQNVLIPANIWLDGNQPLRTFFLP